MPSALLVSSSARTCGRPRVSRRRVRWTPYANASLTRESARAIEQPPHRALRQLLLRPTGMTQHRRAPQPGAPHEVARRLESLRRAPAELTADDFRRTEDAGRAGARTGGDADAAKGVRERAHLLMAGRVEQLALRHRRAAAQQP